MASSGDPRYTEEDDTKWFIVLGLLGALLISALSPSQAAAVTWVSYDDHQYALGDSLHATWTAAQAEANRLGGTLVAINSPGEQQFVQTTFLSGPQTRAVYWIGLSDSLSEGQYVWVTGEPLTFSQWAPGEPDNFGTGEDYSIINWQYGRGAGAPGDWSDCAATGQFGLGGVDAPYRGLIEIGPASGVGESELPPAPPILRVLATPADRPVSVQFVLAGRASVRFLLYDVRGRLIRTLIPERVFQAGAHRTAWDARDDAGRRVSPGVYFGQLGSDSVTISCRVVIPH